MGAREVPAEPDPRPERGRTVRREPPLAMAAHERERSARLLDGEHMLAVFRRELPAWASVPLRVTRCRVKPGKTARSRSSIREGKLLVIYTVGVELGGKERELTLLGVAPAGPELLDDALEERCRALRAHPAVAPLETLAAHLPELEAGLLHFLLDPALPALAEVSGEQGGRLLAPHLEECRRGSSVELIETELRHYKPLHRAVLRVTLTLAAPGREASRRAVYVKLFADERGAEHHRDLAALWAVAQRSRHLRVPEPLGYDAERRMLVMGEAAGRRALAEWIRRLEHGEGLAGDELARLQTCMEVVALALRDLQRSGLEARERRTFRDELATLEKDRRVAAGDARDPGLAREVEDVLRRLEGRAPAQEPLVPSHGGFRHKQTVGDERTLTFVDWDGFCLANPALDAATFLARLREEPASRPGTAPEMERLAGRFREELLAALPEAAPHLALYEALVLAGQALRSFRSSARAGAPLAIRNLVVAAQQALERSTPRA